MAIYETTPQTTPRALAGRFTAGVVGVALSGGTFALDTVLGFETDGWTDDMIFISLYGLAALLVLYGFMGYKKRESDITTL